MTAHAPPPGERPTALLYDWDNTLVDGWAAVTAALNAVFAAFAMPAWTAEDTRSRARLSLRESFPTMFGADWERARDLFYATFRDQHLDHLRPMQGAAEALVAGAAWPQGVVSNKAGNFLRAEVAHLGWATHFRAVVGAGDAAADKPDPAPIHLALQQLWPPRRRLGLVPGGHRAGHADRPGRRGDRRADRRRRPRSGHCACGPRYPFPLRA